MASRGAWFTHGDALDREGHTWAISGEHAAGKGVPKAYVLEDFLFLFFFSILEMAKLLERGRGCFRDQELRDAAGDKQVCL